MCASTAMSVCQGEKDMHSVFLVHRFLNKHSDFVFYIAWLPFCVFKTLSKMSDPYRILVSVLCRYKILRLPPNPVASYRPDSPPLQNPSFALLIGKAIGAGEVKNI